MSSLSIGVYNIIAVSIGGHVLDSVRCTFLLLYSTRFRMSSRCIVSIARTREYNNINIIIKAEWSI